MDGASGSSDQGAVQKHVDADGIQLPYQTHFASVNVGSFSYVNSRADCSVEIRQYYCSVRYHQPTFSFATVSPTTHMTHISAGTDALDMWPFSRAPCSALVSSEPMARCWVTRKS